MSVLTLEQHFYASAPVGLGAQRGFQSVGKSAGLARLELLEPHCAFYRAKDKADLRPANWGWFLLPDGQACLHRISYSGTDELGRPGNFLAHNFVIKPESLDAIDYDIPSLFRAIGRRNPLQFPKPDGSTDGFARRHDQLYELLGWNPKRPQDVPAQERSRLARLPSLSIPLEEVDSARADADTEFRNGIPEPLQGLRARGLLDALVRAVLASMDQRRKIFLFGLGDGQDNSALELSLIDFLFTLLPFHCRRLLTYSTYFSLKPGSADRALPDRRLIVTTRFNSDLIVMNPGESFPAWIINGISGNHRLPSETRAAKLICQLLADDRLEELFRLRRYASRFAFKTEAEGLQTALTFQIAPDADLTPEHYRTFADVADAVRAGEAPFLNTAHRLARELRSPEIWHAVGLQGFCCAYVNCVTRLLPTLTPEGRKHHEEQTAVSLASLMNTAVLQQSWESLCLLLKSLNSHSELESLTLSVVDTFLTGLRDAEKQVSVKERIKIYKEFWTALTCEFNQGTFGHKESLKRSAEFLSQMLLKLDRKYRASLSMCAADLCFPVLVLLPVESPSQLSERLEFVSDLGPPVYDRVGEFLTLLVQATGLTRAVLQAVATDEPHLILRFFPAWKALAKTQPTVRDVLTPLFSDARLVTCWWTLPPELVDELMLRSLTHVLEGWSGTDQRAIRAALAKSVLADVKVPISYYQRNKLPCGSRVLTELGRSQTRFVQLLLHSESNKADHAPADERLAALAKQYLIELLAFQLTRPITSETESFSVLDAPVRLFRRLYPDPKARTQASVLLANCCRAHTPALPGAKWPLLRQWREYLGRQEDGQHPLPTISTEEVDWLTLFLKAIGSEGLSLQPVPLTEMAARLLLMRPALASLKARDAFATYFRDVCQDNEVWHAMAGRLIGDILRDDKEKWLRPDGAYAPLLNQLRERQLLAECGTKIAGLIQQEPDDQAFPRLWRIAEGECAELSDAAAIVFRPLAQGRVSRLLQGCRPDVMLNSCDFVRKITAYLTPELKEKFWEGVAQAFCALPEESQAEMLPRIHMLGRQLRTPEVPWPHFWGKLFAPMVTRGEGEPVLRTFVRVADSLFCPRWKAQGWEDDPDIAFLYFKEIQGVKDGPDLKEFFVSDRELLFPVAARLPDTARTDNQTWAAYVIGRSRLMTNLYSDLYPDHLVKVFLSWSSTAGFTPLAPLAYTLYGFLSAQGAAATLMMAQADKLMGDDIWIPMTRGEQVDVGQVLKDLGEVMVQCQLQHQAVPILKFLRKKAGVHA